MNDIPATKEELWVMNVFQEKNRLRTDKKKWLFFWLHGNQYCMILVRLVKCWAFKISGLSVCIKWHRRPNRLHQRCSPQHSTWLKEFSSVCRQLTVSFSVDKISLAKGPHNVALLFLNSFWSSWRIFTE